MGPRSAAPRSGGRPGAPRSSRAQSPGADSPGPRGMPYTVNFPDGEALDEADLAHPAPLPRVGDIVEYIDASLVTRRYVVREVVHTLQAPPHSGRGPAQPDASTNLELRVGLPKVFLAPAEAKGTSTPRRSRRTVTKRPA